MRARGRSCSRRSASPPIRELRDAIALLQALARARRRTGATSTRTATYEDDDAVTLMDAWWPRLRRRRVPAGARRATLRRAAAACSRSASRHAGGDPPRRTSPTAGGATCRKDLRDAVRAASAARRAGRASTAAAARRRSAAAALQASLREALDGHARSSSTATATARDDPQASCFDLNRSTIASAIDVPPFPFQNRPTFQQTVGAPRPALSGSACPESTRSRRAREISRHPRQPVSEDALVLPELTTFATSGT